MNDRPLNVDSCLQLLTANGANGRRRPRAAAASCPLLPNTALSDPALLAACLNYPVISSQSDSRFPIPPDYGFVVDICSASFTAEYALTTPPVMESDPNGTISPFSAPGLMTFWSA
jgi:hypothetical protein